MNRELETQTALTIEKLPISLEENSGKTVNTVIHYDGRHYDLIYENVYIMPPELKKQEILFWYDQAIQCGDPVLELCCGTGRIAIKLAEKGLQVTGIDSAQSMLVEARKKSTQVEWLEADVRKFNIDKKFSLIIFPINSIWHLSSLEALESCFACVKKHLKPDGKFVIDALNPCTQESIEILCDRRSNLYSVYPDPDGKGTVVVTYSNEFDFTQQIYKQKLFFKLIGQEKETVEEMTYRLYFPQELDALLKYNGFTIESKFGSYARTPFASGSPQQLIVCRL
jgi:ubiquinone/menaquinone biosynthesis C-methylase UbiE